MKTLFKSLFAATIITSLFFATGCKFTDCIKGTETVISEERKLDSFESIEARGSSNIQIIKGDAFNILIKDHGNLLKYFKTEVKSATLTLGFDEEHCINNSNMEVVITMPDLKKIKSLGSGDIDIAGKFVGEKLATAILGSGQIIIKDSCFYKTLNASITGSGDTKAKEGKFENAKIEILGSGSIVVGETNFLDIDIKGSGSVSYYGNPSIKSDIKGSGAISKISK